MASVISSKRDLTIDLAKVLCMAYIVFYQHLANYGDIYSARHYLSYEVTISVMGVFMFYGGWFFKKTDFNSLIGVKKFYKRRFYRFYILFLLSILLLYWGGIILHKPWFDSNLQILLTSLGLSSFYQPNVNTLWFMSMLMLFYILTPLIVLWEDAKWNYITACLVFVVFLISYLYIWPDHIDFRLPLFFFFYAGGLLMPHKEWNRIRYNHSIIGMLIGTVSFIAFAMLSLEGQGGNMIFKFLYVAGFLLWLSAFCSCLKKVLDKWLGGAISVLSYIMLAAYLFHRQIYQLMKYIIENIMGYQLNGYHLAFVFVPSCLILSYCIQYAYDKTIQDMFPRITSKIWNQ